jgi:dTDP-4-dehydrorhamnose 3,5-epimerase
VIDGVELRPLEPKVDERGRVVELFRADENLPGFGQVHLTTVHPGAVKAWHRHARRTDVLAVVAGTVRVGLFDGRDGSPTYGEVNEFFLGVHFHRRLTIPPGVWFGLKGVGTEEALVVVYTDEPYRRLSADEERWDPEANEIPFDWERRDR